MHPRTATIVFSLCKHCFVCVPESWKVNAGRNDQVILSSGISAQFHFFSARCNIYIMGRHIASGQHVIQCSE